MTWDVVGDVLEWRGPAPYLFLPMSMEDSDDLKEAAAGLAYWGQVAVVVRIGGTEFTTAVFPKDGRYLIPLRTAVRAAESLGRGDTVRARVRIDTGRVTSVS